MASGKNKLGNYELISLLAIGGMAEIYLARQTGVGGFERLVVIKKILPHLIHHKRFVQMFFDEARLAAQLSHPNIVQIIELGQQDEDYFLAMEYLEGESLGFFVREARRQGQIPPAEIAAGIVAQVCDGLDYAHRFCANDGTPLKIVHRDISPHNIIVLLSGGVKLVDFGIAKAASNVHQTQAGALKGKYAYMSPEQVRGNPMDGRSDLFSLGVVLWELLCGKRLFKREGEAATMQAVLTFPIPPPLQVRPEVPPQLSAATEKALQRDPDARFQTAAEMAFALREYLRQSSLLGGPAEIAKWVVQVAGERAGDKRRLLALLQNRTSEVSSFSVLKPDTEESFPSRSRSGATPSQKKEPHEDKSGKSESARPSSAIQTALTGFLLLLAATGAYLYFTEATPSPSAKKEFGKSASPATFGADGGKTDSGQPQTSAPSPASEPPRPAAAEPARQTATLEVTSRPSRCRVEIDGVEVPELTPISDIVVEAGMEHRVDVVCLGESPKSKSFSAEAGEFVKLSFDFPNAEPEWGLLHLDTAPWSEVYLGKKRLGMTPLVGIKLPAGEHLLRAVNPQKSLSKEFKVKIRSGATTRLRIDLAPSGG